MILIKIGPCYIFVTIESCSKLSRINHVFYAVKWFAPCKSFNSFDNVIGGLCPVSKDNFVGNILSFLFIGGKGKLRFITFFQEPSQTFSIQNRLRTTVGPTRIHWVSSIASKCYPALGPTANRISIYHFIFEDKYGISNQFGNIEPIESPICIGFYKIFKPIRCGPIVRLVITSRLFGFPI